MPKLDENAFVIDDDGQKLEIDGAPIQVEGAKTQEDVDRATAGLRKEVKTLRGSVRELEAKGGEVEDLKAMISEKEEAIEEAKASARAAAQHEVDKLRSEVAELKSVAANERIRSAVLGHASEFVDSNDLLLRLNGAGRVAEDGSVSFEIETEEGKKSFSPEEAARHVAKTATHLVKGSTASSPPAFLPGNPDLKRTGMTPAQKAEFISEHGLAAFKGIKHN
jgi:hypothetical protein